jgi:HlyD family secretion protein
MMNYKFLMFQLQNFVILNSKMKKTVAFFILVSLLCNNNDKADGYGNFEATEVTISAEANGMEYLNLEEGDVQSQKTSRFD